MTYELGAIDAVCNYEFDDPELQRTGWAKSFIVGKVGAEESRISGLTVEAFLEKMDRAGVEHVLLLAVKAGSAMHTIHRRIPYEKVAEVVAQHPTRFSGLAGVDPTEGMHGVRELERAVKDLGFVGAHLYPHWFEMARTTRATIRSTPNAANSTFQSKCRSATVYAIRPNDR